MMLIIQHYLSNMVKPEIQYGCLWLVTGTVSIGIVTADHRIATLSAQIQLHAVKAAFIVKIA